MILATRNMINLADFGSDVSMRFAKEAVAEAAYTTGADGLELVVFFGVSFSHAGAYVAGDGTCVEGLVHDRSISGLGR